MKGVGPRSVAELRRELEAAAAQTVLARRALADDASSAFDELPARLDALHASVITAPRVELADLRPMLIALLDDLTSLRADLETQMSELEARLQEAGARRQAAAAYRRAGRDEP